MDYIILCVLNRDRINSHSLYKIIEVDKDIRNDINFQQKKIRVIICHCGNIRFSDDYITIGGKGTIPPGKKKTTTQCKLLTFRRFFAPRGPITLHIEYMSMYY